MLRQLVLIAHNIRSTHNIGSLMRTAEGIGIEHLYVTGYTPHPAIADDERLPHIAAKLSKQINKTALDAEQTLSWSYKKSLDTLLNDLRANGYAITGLEQTESSILLPDFTPPPKLAVLLGSEVDGIDDALLAQMDYCLEIPMTGHKESYNVVEAATMLMYHCKFMI